MLCAAAVVVVAGIVGVRPTGPSLPASVKSFLLAWETGDYTGNYSAIAHLTTGDPAVVAASMQAAYRQLGADDLVLGMQGITVHGNTAHATFSAYVDLGRGGPPWQYTGGFTLRWIRSRWLVVWTPSVIVPGLEAGDRLAVLTTVPGRASLEDAAGQSLIRRSPVIEVGVIPDKLASPWRTVRELAAVTGLGASVDQMRGQILAAPPDRFLELVQYSTVGFSQVSKELHAVQGVMTRLVPKRLFSSSVPAVTGQVGNEAAPVLIAEGEPYRPGTTVGLSGLEQTYQTRLAGKPTTEVVVQNSSGHVIRVLQRWAGWNGKPVRTTIDGTIQQDAHRALASSGYAAAIVVIRAGSGQILAVDNQAVRGMPAVDPLGSDPTCSARRPQDSSACGRYEPGQSFTIVPTAALLEGGFGANNPESCPPSITPQGLQAYSNMPAERGLFPQPRPFIVDFANACSTAFAGLAYRIRSQSLVDAAAAFGIGVKWQLPVPAFVGSMHKPVGWAERAADAVGITGAVQVTPLDMALAAGVVASGSWHQPSLVIGSSIPRVPAPVTFKSQIIRQLREFMRATVTSGAARLANMPGLYGQVGVAPLALPGYRGLHAVWFVGYRGNVAFAVLAFSRSASFDPAALIARAFATGLPAGS